MYKNSDRIEQELERYEVLRAKYWEQHFGVLKTRVQEIESEIRSVVGAEPGWIDMTALDKHKDELNCLLEDRKILLDWMFCETPEEVERMRIVNQRLFDLTNRLRVKMADVAEHLVSRDRDDFDDDYEVEGTLRFSYNGDDSVLAYLGDEVYGSDFRIMINVRDWLKVDNRSNQLELLCKYNESRESILASGNLDDGQSWVHDMAGCFDGIVICHTTMLFNRDFGFPVADLLHLNDFWNEVHVRYQNFATQDKNYRYSRN